MSDDLKANAGQAVVIAALLSDYSEFKFAVSNADDHLAIYHGRCALEQLKMLGMSDINRIAWHIEEAKKRLDAAARNVLTDDDCR